MDIVFTVGQANHALMALCVCHLWKIFLLERKSAFRDGCPYNFSHSATRKYAMPVTALSGHFEGTVQANSGFRHTAYSLRNALTHNKQINTATKARLILMRSDLWHRLNTNNRLSTCLWRSSVCKTPSLISQMTLDIYCTALGVRFDNEASKVVSQKCQILHEPLRNAIKLDIVWMDNIWTMAAYAQIRKSGIVRVWSKDITMCFLCLLKKSYLSTESDTKILQSIYFAYRVGIISTYSNRIVLSSAFSSFFLKFVISRCCFFIK